MEYHTQLARDQLYRNGIYHRAEAIQAPPAGFEATLHEVIRHSDGTNVYQNYQIDDGDEAGSQLESSPRSEAAKTLVARLRLLQVNRATPTEIRNLVVRSCGIDEAALLARSLVFPNLQSYGRRGAVSSFSLGFSTGWLVWSYHWETGNTQAVAVHKSPDSPINSDEFQKHVNNLMHPFAIVLLVITKYYFRIHSSMDREERELLVIEKATGHSLPGQDLAERPTQAELTKMSRQLSTLHGMCLYHEVYLESYEIGLEVIKNLTAEPAFVAPELTAGPVWPEPREWEASIAILKTGIQDARKIAKLVLGRLQVQNTVIFNFITQADAEKSIQLAATSVELAHASSVLAKASQQDSSSMKAIAVMTMAFLPATFFAALFSMPLFQWNQSSVIQSQFWIYLVFTLSTTGMVFGLWSFLTGGWLKKKLT